MTHSRKSAAQRQKSLERLRAFRDRKVIEEVAPAPAAPPAPPKAQSAKPPPNPFDNYDSISTPVGMIWREGDRHPTWALPTSADALRFHRRNS